MRRYTFSAALILLLGSAPLIKFLSVTPGGERQANCYHFIFSGAIPLLSPSEGKSFLRELGLDPSLIILGGKNAYQPDSQFEKVYSGLTTQLHLKAVTRLAFYYPMALLEMVRFSFSNAGFYPRLRYPPLSPLPEIKFRFRWSYWSRLHNRFLNGTSYYAAVFFLTSILGILVLKRKDSGWPLFYLLVAVGFFPASLLQAVISVVGNGPLEIVKHQYFANLLLDAAFIFVLCGLIVTGITLWKKSRPQSSLSIGNQQPLI